jgi:type VI secretion system protein ImpL
MMSLWITVALLLLLIILLATIYIHQQWRRKRLAAPTVNSQEQLPSTGDEISSLIREAEAKLHAARLPCRKVVRCPVYLLMGETGAAKTSTMLHSGVEAELVAGQVSQSGGITPTAGANIWYASGALFVEAAGSLLTDARRWKEMTLRLRPTAWTARKSPPPARAAVVFFDCENFTRPGALEAGATSARALRARLGEVCECFGIKLPVYVLFTKLDRIPFFTEYVRNFSDDEAAQALGAALPIFGVQQEGAHGQEQTERLTASFERVFRSLADGRIEFLARESDAGKLPTEYELPREFRKIRDMAVRFMVDVCRPSQLASGPFLRGFYFSGVRPVTVNEAAPIEHAAREQAASAGGGIAATGIFCKLPQTPAVAPVQRAVTGTRRVPQWMFLSRFFHDVLLADRSAIIASGSSLRARQPRRVAL